MAVSAVKTEAAPPEEAPRPAAKKGIVKLLLIVVLVAAAGGGAWWKFAGGEHDAAKPAKVEPAKPPVFLPLETFTVNLVLVDNPQFLQTSITLKVADVTVVEALKLHMPVVRDRILMLMSSRKAADLLTLEGKRKLGEEIVASVNEVLGAGAVAKAKPAAKPAEAKGADAKAGDEDEDKDKDAKGAAEPTKDAKDADEDNTAEAPARPVQAVLFTSFIIQ